MAVESPVGLVLIPYDIFFFFFLVFNARPNQTSQFTIEPMELTGMIPFLKPHYSCEMRNNHSQSIA